MHDLSACIYPVLRCIVPMHHGSWIRHFNIASFESVVRFEFKIAWLEYSDCFFSECEFASVVIVEMYADVSISAHVSSESSSRLSCSTMSVT